MPKDIEDNYQEMFMQSSFKAADAIEYELMQKIQELTHKITQFENQMMHKITQFENQMMYKIIQFEN